MKSPRDDDPLFGPAAPELGWVPAPRYVLRRHRILRLLKTMQPNEALEIGCGAGMLLQELSVRGFKCSALETSTPARALIQAIGKKTGHVIDVHAEPSATWHERFPLLMAFEVLEHIEDDASALRQWREWLAPGGTLLLSVPADQSKWNAADVWAGHFRRYEPNALIELLGLEGFEVAHVERIGYPLGNLSERLQARGIRRAGMVTPNDDKQANTDRSGIERDHVMRLYPLINSFPGRLAIRAALLLQAATTRLPLGHGLLLRAHRTA